MQLRTVNLTLPVIPAHAKVGIATAVTSIVIWLLVTYVPSFHQGVPVADAVIVSSLVTSAVGAFVAWWDKQASLPKAN